MSSRSPLKSTKHPQHMPSKPGITRRLSQVFLCWCQMATMRRNGLETQGIRHRVYTRIYNDSSWTIGRLKMSRRIHAKVSLRLCFYCTTSFIGNPRATLSIVSRPSLKHLSAHKAVGVVRHRPTPFSMQATRICFIRGMSTRRCHSLRRSG